jgi:hypothetical protein
LGYARNDGHVETPTAGRANPTFDCDSDCA